jgi:hypothetical protein
MTTNRCGTCRFWGTEQDAIDNEMFRSCKAVIHDSKSFTANDSQEWHDDEEINKELRELREANKAAVRDGSGYWAALKVREDFGCILWEPKEQG